MPIASHPYLEEQTACCPHLAHLREHATSGIKHIMAFAEEMETVTETLPDDLKPLGELLTKISMRVLTESYAESLMLIAERGLQEITRAAQDSQSSTPAVGCPSRQETTENKWRE
jgi:hypothetical protein